ncbi:transcription-repair coupling factor (superfamily II helicase) [Cryobacterium sp. MP_3.1]|uniref:Transcription-repair-coupling factor n=1 Tax=Cryobacterium zongtaii TaxID=1259217 RepID=A0A2S3ZQ53_9MICO|nr:MULTISPECIES: transcription-repair coupling factor [Cryobacterium]MEC5183690.1 transcription-repair coupling factor (superfamily II helicase) [Cryobacterium sp. MP_3.1]POH71358.1 transcription-repair coupling factor [Cryobacterium zongtaii]TFC50972.1 transcription-repair coupling factor [Cryobacterium sp. TMB3-1-2]TFC57618.1 transcription-repair coupling factor [Cryobacterium sp. TMB1-7]TFC74318.1 transcription-repair coupling factor [Cryobacterium sp. TMB3-15]
MILQGLIPALSRASTFDAALAFAARDADFSLTEGLRAPLLAALLEQRDRLDKGRALLIITATGRESEALRENLGCFSDDAEIVEFPAWETLPHERLSPSAEIVGRRLYALRRMRDWEAADAATRRPLIVVASVRAALQPVADNLTDYDPLELTAGGRGHDLAAIAVDLVNVAYARVDMVTRRGEFAVRGGILDVFPPMAAHPYRIEFFGDEVEQIRAFAVADQRSMPEPIESVTLPPSRELLLSPAVRQRAREMQHEFPSLAGLLAKVAEGIPVEGMESLAPALVDRLVPVTHYLPRQAAVAVISPERVASRAISLAETNREFLSAAWNAATAGAEAPIDLASGDFLTLGTLRDAVRYSAPGAGASERVWWTLSSFQAAPTDIPVLPEHREIDELLTIRIEGDAVPSFAGSVEGAVGHLSTRLKDGWTVAVVAQGAGLVDRAADVLSGAELPARIVEEFPANPEPGIAYLIKASITHGFEIPETKLTLVSESEFYGRTVGYDARQIKKLASRRKNVVDPLQLKTGDHVVHQTHGIGKFLELTQREVSSGGRNPVKTTREYLVLEYAPSKRGHGGDKLYVPTDQLDLVSRYVGGEAPALSKMGGSDWSAAKTKARRAVRDIAVELVKLYSARMASKGHAFGPDTPWQRELEEAFPFAETPDQLTTIEEVKADMERPIPMDRLLSGDVGFGKTEVAVRAAFKAIQDGKQVAMLVPTTLLVRQHMETFQERFAGFPIHLRALSRFQTDKESRETVAGMLDGTVDMVIGTHRLLSENTIFKDLGLVIIDEEQRFGVEHKDALKKLKTNVDILAMSATPIPRTLEMAVTGIREMSTLATPPEDRHPILTFVGPYSDRQVAAAIRRELLREGQIFFVHNRVSSINRVAAQLAELVPEARVAVAHGQLPEAQLEQVVVDFWENKFDILVSTTIIETGLDIANANTIIIDRADKYGLSQLHQLRGRVGRARERAYAYFLYDENKPLSEIAHDRLATIAANNELGAGMQVALKDLEIRGAGNLLGGEQAGHIAGVGFDLYLRMIGEAVSTFRGDVAEGQTELRLELPVDAHIPEEYVDSERLRLEAYQKLSGASGLAAADDQIGLVLEELTDRYGEPPEAVTNLIAVSRLRRHAQQAGLGEVVAMGSNLRVAPVDLADSMQVRVQRMYPGAKYSAAAGSMIVPLPRLNGEPLADAALIAWTGSLLDAVFPRPVDTAVPAH